MTTMTKRWMLGLDAGPAVAAGGSPGIGLGLRSAMAAARDAGRDLYVFDGNGHAVLIATRDEIEDWYRAPDGSDEEVGMEMIAEMRAQAAV